MPKRSDNRVEDLKWGKPKKQRALLLTDDAIDLIDDAAEVLGTTRSEAIEQLIRGYAPLLASNFISTSLPTLAGLKKGRSTSKRANATPTQQMSLEI